MYKIAIDDQVKPVKSSCPGFFSHSATKTLNATKTASSHAQSSVDIHKAFKGSLRDCKLPFRKLSFERGLTVWGSICGTLNCQKSGKITNGIILNSS